MEGSNADKFTLPYSELIRVQSAPCLFNFNASTASRTLQQALFDPSKGRCSVGLGADQIFDPAQQSAYPREGPEGVHDDGLGQGLNSSNSRSQFA